MKKCYKIVRKLATGERVSCITPAQSGLREVYCVCSFIARLV